MDLTRNPKQEAQDYIDAHLASHLKLTAYILEPSPPAQNEPPLFADMPAQITTDIKTALSPVLGVSSKGGTSYNSLGEGDVKDFEGLKDFCAQRWLGFWKELPPLPEDWIQKMEDAHRLAFAVVSEARKQANGKFGLRWIMDGFGTPFFVSGDMQKQIRIAGNEIILQQGPVSSEAGNDSNSWTATTSPVSTLKSAAEFLGVEPSASQREEDSPELGDIERQLVCDLETNAFLGDLFGLAFSALEELAFESQDPSPVQIWPGHFDAAIEASANGNRATFGASPGDADHYPEPYFYIGPHIETDKANPFWNAESFGGAVLPLSEFAGSSNSAEISKRNSEESNERQKVLEFFRKGIQLLADATG